MAANADLTQYEECVYEELKTIFSQSAEPASPASLEFLERDFGEVDLSVLPSELTAQQVVQSRLDEIEKCLKAEAPLAAVFLVGSTLEGLLMEVAMAHSTVYTSSNAAPKQRGRPKPLNAWNLSELITVSESLGIVGKEVLKHADQVRQFRNYIHPRQQLRENFELTTLLQRQIDGLLQAVSLDQTATLTPDGSPYFNFPDVRHFDKTPQQHRYRRDIPVALNDGLDLQVTVSNNGTLLGSFMKQSGIAVKVLDRNNSPAPIKCFPSAVRVASETGATRVVPSSQLTIRR